MLQQIYINHFVLDINDIGQECFYTSNNGVHDIWIVRNVAIL